MPTWIKPSYIVILLLLAAAGLQTWRLSSAHLDLAKAQTAQAELVADIATKRAEGMEEVRRQEAAARAELEAKHESIVSGLEKDKNELQKHYDATYGMLYQLSTQDKFSCLAVPLPEETLKDFRR